MGAIRRIGIMTGGGDCPGLNAVVRAVVLAASRQHGWEVMGIEDAFHGLVDLAYRSPRGNRLLGPADVVDILKRGGTILGTSNRADPFRFPMARDGRTVEEDVSERVLANAARLGLDALVSVGGDGSMRIAAALVARGMRIVGVPKTIDNDLAATDTTFGFDTAVEAATQAIDRIQDTAESHDRVMLVEVMGRDAGWIALHAGIAAGAHGILLPEIPYRLDAIVDLIEGRRRAGAPFTVVVVAEGARPEGGPLGRVSAIPGGMPRLTGAAGTLAAALEEHVTMEVRTSVLGYLQRGGTPTQTDRVLGTRFGEHAVACLARGEFGCMVALRTPDVVSVPIGDAVRERKLVRADDPCVRAARAIGVSFGDEPPRGAGASLD